MDSLKFDDNGPDNKPDEVVEEVNDLEKNDDNEQEEYKDKTAGNSLMRKSALESKMFSYPRLFSVVSFIILPLLVLIGVCFLFGHILAVVEMPAEIAANQESLAARLQLSIDIREYQELTTKLGDECFIDCTNLKQESNDTEAIEELSSTNWTQASACYDNCTSDDRVYNVTLEDYNKLMELVWGDVGSLSFHWMNCAPESYVNLYPKEFPLDLIETNYTYERYVTSYIKQRERWLPRVNMSDEMAKEEAFQSANGHPNCKANTNGGAMFWFTIMTTIGYGNTAPATTGGRMLVYTIGFLSVLLFTAVIGQAGYVMVVICDDLFERGKYTRRLTSGWIASLFWLVCYYLWNLVFAYISILYAKTRMYFDFPLSDAFWFSYISTTTIGFGDHHIKHNTLKWYDLFWIPLPMLMGFVLLANFALKFSEWIWEVAGANRLPSMGLDEILKEECTKTSGGLGGRAGVAENPKLVGNMQK